MAELQRGEHMTELDHALRALHVAHRNHDGEQQMSDLIDLPGYTSWLTSITIRKIVRSTMASAARPSRFAPRDVR
jgi:hypothetical protein